MYKIRTEESFDSAHFLAGYDGKCSNLHGHRWRIVMEAGAKQLHEDGQLRGMITDFGDIRRDLKKLADFYDHALIYESGTLKPLTIQALQEENFRLIEVPFRPTAENFAKFFYNKMTVQGYQVMEMAVYETPNNCAVYSESERKTDFE